MVVLAQFSNHSSKHSSGATAIILHSTERKDARIAVFARHVALSLMFVPICNSAFILN